MLDLTSKLNRGLAIAGLFLGGIIVFLIMSALLPSFLDSGKSVTENVTNADTGSTIGDTIAQALGPFIPLGLIVGVIGLVFAAVKFGNK